MTKRFLSADAFQRDCARLARMIFDDPTWRPDFILALWRGGAQPGVIISEVFAFLGRPTPHAIVKCASYSGIAQRAETVAFQFADALLDSLAGRRVLVVDDVFDTGKTAEAALARLADADARIATVYWKPAAALVPFGPHYHLRETADWLVFPHELQGLTPGELHVKDPELADILLR